VITVMLGDIHLRLGTGDSIRAGIVGWTTVTLAPGRFELLCNRHNHYANGMWQRITVA
jgi:uncharacterized cupredoxin-like copper-binding protein